MARFLSTALGSLIGLLGQMGLNGNIRGEVAIISDYAPKCLLSGTLTDTSEKFGKGGETLKLHSEFGYPE